MAKRQKSPANISYTDEIRIASTSLSEGSDVLNQHGGCRITRCNVGASPLSQPQAVVQVARRVTIFVGRSSARDAISATYSKASWS